MGRWKCLPGGRSRQAHQCPKYIDSQPWLTSEFAKYINLGPTHINWIWIFCVYMGRRVLWNFESWIRIKGHYSHTLAKSVWHGDLNIINADCYLYILSLVFLALVHFLQLPMFISLRVSPKPQCKFGDAQPIISSRILDTVSFSYLENTDSSLDKGKAQSLPKVEAKCGAPTAQWGCRGLQKK